MKQKSMQLELIASSEPKGCTASRYKNNISTFQGIALNALPNNYKWGRAQGWATILWFISGSISDVLPLPHSVCKYILFCTIYGCLCCNDYYYYYCLCVCFVISLLLFFSCLCLLVFNCFVFPFVYNFCVILCVILHSFMLFFYWNCPINTNCNIQFYKIG